MFIFYKQLGKWPAIRNTEGKETEYFSSFCSLKIIFQCCFCYYNLSTSRHDQGSDVHVSHLLGIVSLHTRNVMKDKKS